MTACSLCNKRVSRSNLMVDIINPRISSRLSIYAGARTAGAVPGSLLQFDDTVFDMTCVFNGQPFKLCDHVVR
jgi:hypothetical protein